MLIGNYMNSGSKNEQAFAFEISFLPKVLFDHKNLIHFDQQFNNGMFFQLSSTKDVENKFTMLHYLVDIIEKKFPDVLNFSDELPHVNKAAKISTETIQNTLRQMEINVKNLQTDLANSRVPQCDDDKFEEVMSVSFFYFLYRVSNNFL